MSERKEEALEALGISLKLIQDSPQTWSISKSLAFKLSFGQYMLPGDFLQQLADADLDFLMHRVEALNGQDDETITEFMLLCVLLAFGEGLDITDDSETISRWTNIVASMVVSESMARKGLLTIKYDRVSLGDDAETEPVIELTDAGRDLYGYLRDNPEV